MTFCLLLDARSCKNSDGKCFLHSTNLIQAPYLRCFSSCCLCHSSAIANKFLWTSWRNGTSMIIYLCVFTFDMAKISPYQWHPSSNLFMAQTLQATWKTFSFITKFDFGLFLFSLYQMHGETLAVKLSLSPVSYSVPLGNFRAHDKQTPSQWLYRFYGFYKQASIVSIQLFSENSEIYPTVVVST